MSKALFLSTTPFEDVDDIFATLLFLKSEELVARTIQQPSFSLSLEKTKTGFRPGCLTPNKDVRNKVNFIAMDAITLGIH